LKPYHNHTNLTLGAVGAVGDGKFTTVMVGALEHEWIMTFHSYWEFHDPN